LDDGAFKLCFAMLALAFDPEHKSPAFGMVAGTVDELTTIARMSTRDVARSMKALVKQGYVHKADDTGALWAIACPEYFDPRQPMPEHCIDPARDRT
jgi:hypothetical protein